MVMVPWNLSNDDQSGRGARGVSFCASKLAARSKKRRTVRTTIMAVERGMSGEVRSKSMIVRGNRAGYLRLRMTRILQVDVGGRRAVSCSDINEIRG